MKCLCHHRNLTSAMIERTEVECGVAWNYYRICPVHGIRAIEPVLTADLKMTTVLSGNRTADQGL